MAVLTDAKARRMLELLKEALSPKSIGAADIFSEIITQPFPGFDGITGLIQPSDCLMRSRLYQRMYSSTKASTSLRVCSSHFSG